MLHDITLDTTRAEKVEWVNRFGQTIINNATHKYVYGKIIYVSSSSHRYSSLQFPLFSEAPEND